MHILPNIQLIRLGKKHWLFWLEIELNLERESNNQTSNGCPIKFIICFIEKRQQQNTQYEIEKGQNELCGNE